MLRPSDDTEQTATKLAEAGVPDEVAEQLAPAILGSLPDGATINDVSFKLVSCENDPTGKNVSGMIEVVDNR